ncbi:TauD/TfdA family dioxygenase [Kiloniella sp. b19]|uniref:TauD/TfdA family dioxygenase n=1 Tax=Kiloniella sp. GXU_MW_B19 TaxID=3141326 RepID=UPI0031DA6858
MLDTVKTNVELGANGLNLTFPGGTTSYFNYFWLRDNCPSSFDAQTRERTFDILAEPEAPTPEKATIEGQELVIIWNNGSHVTRFDLDYLAPYGRGEKRHDPADLKRVLWLGDHYDKMARFSQPELVASKETRAKWAKAMLEEGVAIITDMPDTDAALLDTAGLAGTPRPTFFGPSFEVKLHINPINLAYTAKALELHTDVPAEELAPGVQYLHCRRNSVDGGYSIFMDGAAAAEDFRISNPEDFKILSEVDIPFFKEHDDHDMRAIQRVIELDEHGAVSGLSYSQHLLDVIDLDQKFLDSYYPAFFRFGKALQNPKYVMRFRLNAGECIVFDNHRILHGREAFTAESGERHLRGTYTDRGEMRSLYRVSTRG